MAKAFASNDVALVVANEVAGIEKIVSHRECVGYDLGDDQANAIDLRRKIAAVVVTNCAWYTRLDENWTILLNQSDWLRFCCDCQFTDGNGMRGVVLECEIFHGTKMLFEFCLSRRWEVGLAPRA